MAHLNPRHSIKLAKYALAGWVPGGKRSCAMCGRKVWRFMPYQSGSAGTPPLMRALAAIGSDPDCYECPRCGSSDRERHLLMYMRSSGVLEDLRGKSVLHFAPEKRLSQSIRAAQPARYLPCDLFPKTPEVQRVNMLEMPFENHAFDYVIANHVLEHVADDLQALREIRRVLKFGGHAILQTPFASKLCKTWQDPGVDTDAARLQAYGQSDHVRLYGRDIFERIRDAGFDSLVRQHSDVLPEVDPGRSGVNADEPFFLFRSA